MKPHTFSETTNIQEALELDPRVVEEFRRLGLKCFDCAATEVETLRDAARYHEKPLEEILEALKKLKIPNPKS